MSIYASQRPTQTHNFLFWRTETVKSYNIKIITSSFICEAEIQAEVANIISQQAQLLVIKSRNVPQLGK